MLKQLFLLLVSFGAIVGSITLQSCATAPLTSETLNQAVTETRARLGTSALSAAVFNQESVIDNKTVGTQSVLVDLPVPNDARWYLGSCTKAMTATLVGRLVERDVLQFETTVGEVFQESIHPNYKSVSVAQLLRHHGGVTGAISLSHPQIWQAMWEGMELDNSQVRRNAVLSILSDPSSQFPGVFTYSNAGFLVVAAMIEEITRESWESLIQRELFDPLGMSSAGFSALKGSSPWPHKWSEGRYTAMDPEEPGAGNPPPLGPAGAVHVSMRDWIKFLQVFLDGGPDGFLSKETLTELVTPLTNQAAAGWYVVERGWAGGDSLVHAGSNTMNYALVWLAPEKGQGIILATNGANPDTFQILDGLAGWMINRYITLVE